jgi:hypothetical protein
MASSNSSPDPIRWQLREVRRGFFRLHKTLVDAERAAFEKTQGRLSNGQFLQALIQDPFFAWLRPYSSLLVEIDEALAAKERLSEPSARAYIEQVRALVAPVEGEEASNRYEHVRQRDPNVLVAHVELTAHIGAATNEHLEGQ